MGLGFSTEKTLYLLALKNYKVNASSKRSDMGLLPAWGKTEQIAYSGPREAYTEEPRLMELLADEEADEDRLPDDGELEGLGDDFNG